MLKIDGYNKNVNKKSVFEDLLSILLEGPRLGTGVPVMGEIQPRVGLSEKHLVI